MRILVLGGTWFVGRAIAEDALCTGAEVTLFGRGKSGSDLFPELTRLRGDRDTGDYAALHEGSWDAVVDVTGYVPRHVGRRWTRWATGWGGICSSPATRCTGTRGCGRARTRTRPAMRRCAAPRYSTARPMARSRSPARTTWWLGTGGGDDRPAREGGRPA